MSFPAFSSMFMLICFLSMRVSDLFVLCGGVRLSGARLAVSRCARSGLRVSGLAAKRV